MLFPHHASFTANITIHQLDAVPFLSGHFAVSCKLKHSRSSTLFHPLKDHSVCWNHHLSTPIRLDLDRLTGHVSPSPLKLSVIHRPSDPHHHVHPLGALHLNLSAYVGQGPVQRRYLLRDSKTNATLKLTIQLDFVSGQTSYIPPPLPKAEILNGLSAYLQVSRTPSSSSTPPTDDPIPPPPPSIAYPTTESLIEAIFNPVQIGDHSTHSPFTLYVPPPLNLSSSSTSSTSISSSSISNSNKL